MRRWKTRDVFSIALIIIFAIVVIGNLMGKFIEGEIHTILASLLAAVASYLFDTGRPRRNSGGEDTNDSKNKG